MIDKVQKIREEIVGIINSINLFTPDEDGKNSSYEAGKLDVASKILQIIDSMQKEPKECMYSKDDYTDEDRKVLCGGCEEDCRFNKKEESVNNGIDLGCGVIWKDEEPASEDFEAEVKKLWMEINTGHSYSIVDSYNIFYGLCMDIADWQKEQLMKDAVDGLVVCNNLTHGFKDIVMEIPSFLNVGDKVKVIILKED
jgi:hypothetical protein